MAAPESHPLDILRSSAAIAASCLLLAQAVAFYVVPKSEAPVMARPLTGLPAQLGSWTTVQETPVEPEVQAVLKATDTLSRIYFDSARGAHASLFVAFFASQRAGVAPHSPKNCLPGSGWAPISSGTLQVPVPGRTEPVEVNRYLVARGSEKTVVLYWYQTPHRITASEYLAKIWLVLDSVRYRRSDTSLVRIIVPAGDGEAARAEEKAVAFMQSLLPPLSAHLPH